MKQDNFDLNLINHIFDTLGMTEAEKQLMLAKVVQEITKHVLLQADVDEAKVQQFLDKKDIAGLNDYFVTQLGGPEVFAEKIQEASGKFLTELISATLESLPPEEAAKLQIYLVERDIHMKELEKN